MARLIVERRDGFYGRHMLPVQVPEQQSVPTLQGTPPSWHGKSQKSPTQDCEQHWALVVQLRPVARQTAPPSPGKGGAHLGGDPAQRKLQHSAFDVHAPPSAPQGIWQTR